MERERISSRLGFIFLSAACAIGLGNIWRFPYIVGLNGGAFFVLFYLIFLVVLGYPLLSMELSQGRASQLNLQGAYRKLANPESRVPWYKLGVIGFAGNMLLMMYYTSIAAWLIIYTVQYASGSIMQYNTQELVKSHFQTSVADTPVVLIFLAVTILFQVQSCSFGVQKGIEKLIKYMMGFLLVALFLLAIKALTLPGTAEGLKFYLLPNWETFMQRGIWNVTFDAMGQAFFTLSLGVGSMTIFGSYLDKKDSLAKEAIWIIALDTFVALMAGIIVFPICFSYNVNQSSGPELIFVSLPNIFQQLPGGRYWGFLFFAFLVVAAMTTVIAVVENIMAFFMDELHCSRKISAVITGGSLFVLSLPAALGFGLLSGIQPMGENSTILDLEDFIMSNNLLPFGCLLLVLFCTRNKGWGLKNFLQELNTGDGVRIPENNFLKIYLSWILPVIILVVFIGGYLKFFFK